MDSWPLWVQWVLLALVGVGFLGSSWWLTLSQARAEDAEPATWGGRARMVFGEFRIGDWTVVVVLVAFLVPLVVQTLAGR